MILKNEHIKVEVDALGAELKSMVDLKSNREYMWQGDPAFWKRTSPVLFPIVGNLINNAYEFQGAQYNLSQHGFARDKIFSLMKQTETEASFSLLFDEDTLEKYPFKFELQIIYKIEGKQCQVAYRVINHDTQFMYFSIGAHPAFNCPLIEGSKFEDYQLVISPEIEMTSYELSEDMSTVLELKRPIEHEKGSIPLNYELFKRDALILDSEHVQRVQIAYQEKAFVEMVFAKFPYLGIWTPKSGTPFVCIEPWYGIKDFENHKGNLTEKIGIQQLAPAGVFNCEYSIHILEE